MRKVLVHIGTGKTGSTSIQSYLRSTPIAELSFPEIYHVNHNILEVIYRPFSDWTPMHHRQFGRMTEIEIHRLKSRLRRKFLKSIRKSKNVILSGEVVYMFSNEQIRRFKTDLSESGFDDICILLYLREPASYYMSEMQQKSRHSSSFTDPMDFHFPYQETCRKWMDVDFTRILVRPFDKSLLPGGDVVRDFQEVCSDFFGFGLPTSEQPVVRNPSLSVESINLLQCYRRINAVQDVFEHDSMYFNLLIRLINMEPAISLKLTQPRLRPEIADAIRFNHRTELDYMNNSHRIAFPGVNALTDDSMCYKAPSGVDVERFESICTGFDRNVYENLLFAVLTDYQLRHLNESKYLDWLRIPYWRVRRWIGLK